MENAPCTSIQAQIEMMPCIKMEIKILALESTESGYISNISG